MTRELRCRINTRVLRTVLGIVLVLSRAALPSPAEAQSWVKTTAPHTNWSSIASSSDGSNLVAAASATPSAPFTLAPGPIFTSKDGGITWTQTQAPLLVWKANAVPVVFLPPK